MGDECQESGTRSTASRGEAKPRDGDEVIRQVGQQESGAWHLAASLSLHSLHDLLDAISLETCSGDGVIRLGLGAVQDKIGAPEGV